MEGKESPRKAMCGSEENKGSRLTNGANIEVRLATVKLSKVCHGNVPKQSVLSRSYNIGLLQYR